MLVCQQRSDPNQTDALLGNPQTHHLFLLRRCEDEHPICPTEKSKEVAHHDAPGERLHSWTEIRSDKETSPALTREGISRPREMFPPHANVMHDIHAAWHSFETPREIGANGRIKKPGQQKATGQQWRHPTPGKKTRLKPVNGDPLGVVLIVAPRGEEGGIQKVTVSLIRPLRYRCDVMAFFPKQSRNHEPM